MKSVSIGLGFLPGRMPAPGVRCGMCLRLPSSLRCFLINGQTNERTGPGLFQAGERVRFTLYQCVGHVDWYDVRNSGSANDWLSRPMDQLSNPLPLIEFRFAVAEYPIYYLLFASWSGLHHCCCESIDRTGFAFWVLLAPREGMKGLVPAHRPRFVY